MNGRKSYGRRGALGALLSASLLLWTGALQAQEGDTDEPQQETEQTETGEAAYGEAGMEAAMMEAWEAAGTPGAEHQRLAQLEGEWDVEVQMWMDPSAEPTVTQGTSTMEMMMNGRFLQETVNGEFMGEPFHGRNIVGYNNITDKYESSWIDNHSTAVYTGEGSYDEASQTYTWTSQYADPATGQTHQTKGVMEVVSEDELHYVDYMVAPDGSEIKHMEITYTRQ